MVMPKNRLPTIRENAFPDLLRTGYEVTSKEDQFQNCFGYAAGEAFGWWTPIAGSGYQWPQELPRKTDVDTFVEFYNLKGGYVPCDTGELEEGFEKVVLYVDSNNEVSHAALQKENGVWTSKLGVWEDIEHSIPEGLNGDDPAYGKIARFLKRPRK